MYHDYGTAVRDALPDGVEGYLGDWNAGERGVGSGGVHVGS